ncbi:hypothetical protein J1N35_044289 [Gossypium stocksii]|uniref:Uncharacterized protein n=1 Tax=Gossypium stocksii TaxID=47602 RepID=A0A9D3U938_9ROSI|nr:hypothetical protein J1N35_044289 [Gossypium stocksii]
MDRLKLLAKKELQHQGVQELSKVMVVAESLFELVPRRNKFKSSKPKETGNSQGDEEGSFENSNDNSGNGNPRMESGSPIVNQRGHLSKLRELKRIKKKSVDYFLCCGLHRMWDCPELSKISTTNKEKAEPVESKVLKHGSMILSSTKVKRDRKQKGLIESTKKIKIVNSKEVPTVGVAQRVELHISQWKGKEDFEVIHLDDYNFVIGLKFHDKINTLLVPFSNCMCIMDT